MIDFQANSMNFNSKERYINSATIIENTDKVDLAEDNHGKLLYNGMSLHAPGIYLTKRESECFYLLARVNTIKKVAKILNISPRTAEGYIHNIKCKMGIASKSELIQKAFDLMFSANIAIA